MLTTLVWIAVVAFPVSEILLAVFKRARAHDAALGDSYAIYCRRTKRILPGVL